MYKLDGRISKVQNPFFEKDSQGDQRGVFKRNFGHTEKFVPSQRWHLAKFAPTGKLAPSRSLKNSPQMIYS
jgi:hypothetical protein